MLAGHLLKAHGECRRQICLTSQPAMARYATSYQNFNSEKEMITCFNLPISSAAKHCCPAAFAPKPECYQKHFFFASVSGEILLRIEMAMDIQEIMIYELRK